MHKCIKYCKRIIKVSKTYVSRCRFNFPRHSMRDDFYNSLLFVPYRDEGTLVMERETMEEDFRRHREASIRGISTNYRNYYKLNVIGRKLSMQEIKPLHNNKDDDEPLK